ncbi:YtfJ family protein [Rosenbergiella epipactidis]|uniref:YtfJ family protein n=1 Tax=Rosenbergiella epipactidis TaxID=1544694 RepID=UPI001F4E15D7|nr:YtfJ family protein [Rosenbergiella epipactidis]
MTRQFVAVLLSLLPTLAMANNFIIGQPVKPLSVADKGQLILNGDTITYQPWASQQLLGKVRIIQYIAGRSSAKKQNGDMIKAVKAAQLPTAYFQPVTIVNADDELFGTGLFVQGKIEKNQRKYPWAQFVIDNDGRGKALWQLPAASSTIIVTDKQGKVRWQKDGPMTDAEVSHVIQLLRDLVAQEAGNH